MGTRVRRLRRLNRNVIAAAFQKTQSHSVTRLINASLLENHNQNQLLSFNKNTLLRRSYSIAHRFNQSQPELSIDLINIVEHKLSAIESRHAHLQAIADQPDALSGKYSAANRELKKLRYTIDVVTELRNKQKEIVGLKSLVSETQDDKEMQQMAFEELWS